MSIKNYQKIIDGGHFIVYNKKAVLYGSGNGEAAQCKGGCFDIGKYRVWAQVSDHMPLFMNVRDAAYRRS